jgi:hypothetical protein
MFKDFKKDIISTLHDKVLVRIEEKKQSMSENLFSEEFKVGQQVMVSDGSGQRIGLAKILSIKGNKVSVNRGGKKPLSVDMDQLSKVTSGKPEVKEELELDESEISKQAKEVEKLSTKYGNEHHTTNAARKKLHDLQKNKSDNKKMSLAGHVWKKELTQKEEIELDELKDTTLKNYIYKAGLGIVRGKKNAFKTSDTPEKRKKRRAGMNVACKKLYTGDCQTEETEINEIKIGSKDSLSFQDQVAQNSIVRSGKGYKMSPELYDAIHKKYTKTGQYSIDNKETALKNGYVSVYKGAFSYSIRPFGEYLSVRQSDGRNNTKTDYFLIKEDYSLELVEGALEKASLKGFIDGKAGKPHDEKELSGKNPRAYKRGHKLGLSQKGINKTNKISK